MKERNISARIGMLAAGLLIISCIMAGCGGKNDKKAEGEQGNAQPQENDVITQTSAEETEKRKIENEKPVYLYHMDYGSDTAERVKTYETEWTDSQDIGTFAAITVDGEDFDFIADYGSEISMQQETWDSVETAETYRIGYEISFDIGGEHRIYTILEPADVEKEDDLFMGDVDTDEVTGYLGVWLYDDYHQEGGFYVHVYPDGFNDETLLTSIKLRLTPDGEKITNLRLKAFSYSNSLEFDEDGHYNNEYGCEISIIEA